MKTRYTLGACALAFSMAGAVSAQAEGCHPQDLATKYPSLVGKTIHMGLDPETPPYAQRDAKNMNVMTGSDVDLAKAVFQCAGLKYDFVPGAWSGLMPAIVSGQLDLMFYLYYNPTRAKQVDFVVYMTAGTGILVAKGNPAKIHSNDDLCGKRVAVSLGSVEEAAMRSKTRDCTAASHEPIQILTYPDNASGFRLLQNGRTDAVMNDLALIDSVAKKDPATFERAYSILTGYELGIAVKKGNSDLLHALYDGMKAVQESGGELAVLQAYGIDPTLQLPAAIKTE
jgi:polar amino acid transport system substrate-binding protein